MGLLKALTAGETVRGALCWLGAQYIRLVRFSGRWRVVGGECPAAFWDEGRPFILAFWHGRILMMPYCWRRSVPIQMLISQHRDGQLIARTVAHFGIETLAGSSSRGGTRALRGMVKALRSGGCVGITPDGPRGPRMRASPGVAQIARLAGAPVIPCAFSSRRGINLGSWDRFLVAWPFSRGVFVWGRPVSPPGDGTPEAEAAFVLAVEEGLNSVTREADRIAGRLPVEPAPVPAPEARP